MVAKIELELKSTIIKTTKVTIL